MLPEERRRNPAPSGVGGCQQINLVLRLAQKLGVSRKTVSDLERGAAEHVSLKTAMGALALAGFVLYSAERRPPSLDEIMARRARDRARADELVASQATSARTDSPTPKPARPSRTRRKKGAAFRA